MALVVAGSDVIVYVAVALVAALFLMAFVVGLLMCRYYQKRRAAKAKAKGAMANISQKEEVDVEAAQDQSLMLDESKAASIHS